MTLLNYITIYPLVQAVFLICILLLVIIPYIVHSIRKHAYEKQYLSYKYAEDEHRRRMVEKGLIEQVKKGLIEQVKNER